jgi:hypothetical protein
VTERAPEIPQPAEPDDQRLTPVSSDFMDPQHLLTEGVADMAIPLDRPIVHL